MDIDNPHIRSDNTCPLCLGVKDDHLVCCWSCYRSEGLRYGNEAAMQKIKAREQFLCKQALH